MTPGKFITFEGGEGSGKSTQVRLLAERLANRRIDAVLTREPGGSAFAERLRKLILDPGAEPHSAFSETLLFYAARADHLERIIRPALALGRWVVCDRFSDSTRVYQGHAGTVPAATLEELERLVVAPTKPDLTFIIDLPVEIGLARAEVRRAATAQPAGATRMTGDNPSRVARGLLADRYEARDIDFHRRLRDGFLKIAAAEPERCVVVDGRRGPDEIAAEVWAAIELRCIAGAR